LRIDLDFASGRGEAPDPMQWRSFLLTAFSLVFAIGVRGAERPYPDHSSFIISHLKREGVSSTALATVGYSKRLRVLDVEFVNGAIYRYYNVPSSTYYTFLNAKSKARYYDDNVRRKFHSVHIHRRPAGAAIWR
jgi:hypothetical protein